MLRAFTVAALAATAVLMMTPGVGAGVIDPKVEVGKQWMQVVANGGLSDGAYATAYHGFIDGNAATEGGNPLLGLLNSGSGTKTYTLLPDGQKFTISEKGMFGSIDQLGLTPGGSNVIDTVSYQTDFGGFNHSTQLWEYEGKSDGAGTAEDPNPFLSPNLGKSGTLVLRTPLAEGSYVLSLKGGSQYAVFLFTGLKETTSFDYVMGDLQGKTSALSNAALYRVGPGGVVTTTSTTTTAVAPEPTSLAVFGFGALLGVGGSVRRRFTTRKGLALRGPAI